MCIEHRALNQMAVKDKQPLPLADDLLHKLQGAPVFGVCSLAINTHPGQDVPKMGFGTPVGFSLSSVCSLLGQQMLQREMSQVEHMNSTYVGK